MTRRTVWAGWLLVGLMSCGGSAWAQAPAAGSPQAQQPSTPPPATDDQGGPIVGNDGIVLPKKKDEPAPPPAPAEEKPANPNGAIYSMRVDVPIVNLDVN